MCYRPPTPESSSPAQSSHNVTHYAMPDGTPDAELAHEPSIGFHFPSSRESSLPKSDSSVAGSVAEDDLIDDEDDDGLEALRQVAEGSPSPTRFRFQALGGLTKGPNATDQNADSNMASDAQISPPYISGRGVGDSEHNPIQLDNDIRVQGVVMDESDDEESKVASSLEACDVVLPQHQAVSVPYSYILETAATHGHQNHSTADVGQDSDEFEVANNSDEDDLDVTNNEDTDYVVDNLERESSPPHLGPDRVYQSTYDEFDEEDEDASSSIAETEDEAIVPGESALSEVGSEDNRNGSVNHRDTLQSDSSSTLLVDHTRHQAQEVPEPSTGPIPVVTYSSFLSLSSPVLAHSSILERAPSPSDAAMARPSSINDSQLARSPSERYSHSQNIARIPQSSLDGRTLSTSDQRVTSTEDILRTTTRNPPLVDYGTSGGLGTTWQALHRDQTHYNDGPFRFDANPVPGLLAPAGSVPHLHAQSTASDTRNTRSRASHLFYRENRATDLYDGSLNEDVSWMPGQRDLAANPFSLTPTNGLQSAMSHATPASACEVPNQPESLPAKSRATTRLSIGDILENESTQSPAPVLGTKRKADQISTDQDESADSPSMSQSGEAASNVEDSSLPDAQPRDVSELATQFKSSQSTDSTQPTSTSLGPSRSTALIATRDGRPRKRVKTIAKWIGTTILLGVGAMVTIGATAPQSLWDEIDRELGLA